MKDVKKWLWTQKEGIGIGVVWGLISTYAALGLASLGSLSWWQIILILPSYVGNKIIGSADIGVVSFAVPIVIGAIVGMLIDSLYKPEV